MLICNMFNVDIKINACRKPENFLMQNELHDSTILNNKCSQTLMEVGCSTPVQFDLNGPVVTE